MYLPVDQPDAENAKSVVITQRFRVHAEPAALGRDFFSIVLLLHGD
jgi:hypothetical protein